MKPYNVLISGGGTGGHIYPAIAIANEFKLRYPDANFLFVGAKDRMEMEKVPQAGYKIKGLWISGEASSTGLHGANRLASNGLLEALVYAATAANGIIETLDTGMFFEFDLKLKVPKIGYAAVDDLAVLKL